MPKRKDAELMDGAKRREVLLLGISDRTAVQLYDEAMAQLAERDQATYASAILLRDAAQWTVTINEIQDALHKAVRCSEPDEKRIAALIKNKERAEDARRRILDGLLLTPQRPRGRPPGQRTAGAAEDEPEDDGWDDFGKTASAGGFEDDDGS